MEKYIAKNKATKYCMYAKRKDCNYWSGKDCLQTPKQYNKVYTPCSDIKKEKIAKDNELKCLYCGVEIKFKKRKGYYFGIVTYFDNAEHKHECPLSNYSYNTKEDAIKGYTLKPGKKK